MGCFLMRLRRSIGLSYSTVLASECDIISRKILKEFKIICNFEDLQFREKQDYEEDFNGILNLHKTSWVYLTIHESW